MESNGMERTLVDFDFGAAEKRIKDLQTFKTALSFEISKSQARSEELANHNKFLEEKIEEHKKLKAAVLAEVEQKINESEELNKKLRELRIQYEYEKNDLESVRRNLDAERTTLSLEKASLHERNELREEQLARREKAVEEVEKTVGYKLVEADKRLEEIFKREERVKDLEASTNNNIATSELAIKEANLIKAEAKKLMDEATSTKTIAEEKFRDINAHREDLIAREKTIKTDLRALDEQKVQLKQDKRDLEMEMNKLISTRQRFLKEIDNANIEARLKTELKEEVNENTNKKTV